MDSLELKSLGRMVMICSTAAALSMSLCGMVVAVAAAREFKFKTFDFVSPP